MGKCTKVRCPMQVGAVSDDCDIKDCPYRTDPDLSINIFIEGVQKYLENTIEITKKVRVPKGKHCNGCLFKQHEISLYSDSNGCPIGGGVWCALYGERLKLKDAFLNSPMLAITTPENWTYCKCNRCLEDTNKSTPE